MLKARDKVFWFAVVSRLTILLLQFLCNSICPDHDADAFETPRDPRERVSLLDKLVDLLLGGLTRWDAQHLIHIAKYGYVYESSMAFFPLYPMSLRYVGLLLGKILFMLNKHSVITVTGVLINFLCFVKSSVVLFDLSKKVLGADDVAYKAAILFCVNPASIFFSSLYTETLFSYLTFYTMLAFVEDNSYIYLPLGLSTLARSNGLINIGFPLYASFRYFIHLSSAKNTRSQWYFKFLGNFLWTLNVLFLSIVPFLLLQIYHYVISCVTHHQSRPIEPFLLKYGTDMDLTILGYENMSWCGENIPLPYTHVQKKYWNVGFLKYYEFKQIPNFVLALPILFVMSKCILEFLREHGNLVYSLGMKCHQEKPKSCKYPPGMFVFVVHASVLTIFCAFFVHIQVSTRFLSSASPLLYWYCALTMSKFSRNDSLTYEIHENLYSKWRVFLFTLKVYTLEDKLILMYFFTYILVGSFMFSNFLPWT